MSIATLGSRAIIGRYYQTLEGVRLSSWVDPVSMLFESNQASEEYKWLGMTPMLREWLTGRQAKALRDQGVTITNRHYEATLDIRVEDIRRDKTDQIMVRVDELAGRGYQHWNKLLTTLIEDGEDTACYDGKYFFATDHEEDDSGVQTNDLTTSDYGELGAVGTATNPTADELANVILKMTQHLYSLKDNHGEPMNEDARSFLVMVPVGMWGNAQQAVRSNLLNTGSGARENPLQNTDVSITVAANPRLTWTTKLAVFRTDGRVKALIRQEEVPAELESIAEGSELEMNDKVWRFGIDTWRNVGYGYWQYAVLGLLS